jgi:hypothetical protein
MNRVAESDPPPYRELGDPGPTPWDYDLDTDNVVPIRRGQETPKGHALSDFRAYLPDHKYIFMPTGELWPSTSVNAVLDPQPLLGADGKPMPDKNGEPKRIPANQWLDRNKAVQQMTWVPGRPQIVEDALVREGGFIARPGNAVYNLYREPNPLQGDAFEAKPWIDHLRRVYPDDADHFIRWFAHRVQRPHEKINHALVMGGAQGVGKDTILEPVKAAIGAWNFAEVSPSQIMGRFNGFVKSVILRVSEARDLGDVDRYGFYDHMKTYTAAPPDVLRCDEKFLREHSVFNVTGVIITTNHKTDGIYLPEDDRRHYVAWSETTRSSFPSAYWADLWRWYENGGIGHVAAYLNEYDLSDFDAKAPPDKTPAFWDIVSANAAPENAEMSDALELLGYPAAVTVDSLAYAAQDAAPGLCEWLRNRGNRRQIPHRLEECGYVPVRNPANQDGIWRVSGKRTMVYAKKDLAADDRLCAAERIAQ